MSDMTLIAEDILTTMQALEDAHHAAEVLRTDVDKNTLSTFRVRMLELQARLEKLSIVLGNEEAFAMDELVDAISLASSGHRSAYRKTPRMNTSSN